jgi:UDPglucose--hexose-1-phosphate uridylyltransferase
MNIYEAIKSLVEFGVKENLIEAEDKVWAVNRILEILNMDSMETDAEAKMLTLKKF